MFRIGLLAAVIFASTLFSGAGYAQDRLTQCADNGKTGTKEHFVACMSAHFSNSKRARSGFPLLPQGYWSCHQLFETYANRVANKSVPIKADCAWLADLMRQQVPEEIPNWVACTKYEPNSPQHIDACLRYFVENGILGVNCWKSSHEEQCRSWQHYYGGHVAKNNERVIDPHSDLWKARKNLALPSGRTEFVAPPCSAYQTVSARMPLVSWGEFVWALPYILSAIPLLLSLLFIRTIFRDVRQYDQTILPIIHQSLRYSHKTATIAGASNWSETRVRGSSSGGGGYIGPYGGTISAPSVSISSTVTSKHQFFLVSDDGQEIPVTLSNASLATRDGQVADAISVHGEGVSNIVVIYVRQLRDQFVFADVVKQAARSVKLHWKFKTSVLIVVAFLLASLSVVAYYPASPAVGLVVGVFAVFVVKDRTNRIQREIKATVFALLERVKSASGTA